MAAPPSPAARLRRTWRYARHWSAGGPPVDEGELPVDRGDRTVPASVFRTGRSDAPLRAWIVLHGITRPGRVHPSLLRFARSLARTGAVVVVPEVPEWIDLDLAPGRTLPTVAGTLDVVERDLGVPGARTGLMGFSFGAPQALVTAGDPALAGRLGGVAGFGGYCDLERTFRFLFSGVHEWDGVTRRRRPDPYGRWIVAANFLARVEGYEHAEPVADALRSLARAAGEIQVPSWDPVHDPVKVRLRETLDNDDHRALFDRFAPPADRDPAFDDDEAREWAARLAEAGRRTQPLADPLEHIGRLPDEVHLLHGRGDDLIPFTETLRLARGLEARQGRPLHTAVTGLFAHSAADRRRHPLRTAGEAFRFAHTLSRVLGAV